MIKSILASWGAVEVDYDFETGLAGPVDGFVEVGCCSWCVWSSDVDVGPIAHRDADSIEACVLDFLEVLERDEGVPVWFEYIEATLFAELLAERPFIYHLESVCVCTLKDGRGDVSSGC